MASIEIYTQKTSQALRGQNVKITLTAEAAISYLSQLSPGMRCVDDNTGENIGYIYSVDYYGNSFEVCPSQPDKSFNSGTPGYFSEGYLCDVYTS